MFRRRRFSTSGCRVGRQAVRRHRPDPQAALDTLIALNHRYALDGSDPNSYGGLLWSLGLFDRPMTVYPVLDDA